MPTPEQFCAALGVGDDFRVGLYDTNYTAWAARVWWMLHWVGFGRAAILDDGLGAWAAEGRPLSVEPVNRPAKQLTPKPRPELIADRNEVLASIEDDAVCLIDTLPEEFYHGDIAMYGRPGHIPGAVNINVMKLLDKTGHFRSEQELVAMHNFDRDARIVTYCGGGIMASTNDFIMTRLGYNNVAVYTASLQEWAADPAKPMVVDTT